MQSEKKILESRKQSGRWSRKQHQRFMLGLMQYGKNWKKVQQIVGTRSGSQVRSHAQKFFNKLQKNKNYSHHKNQNSQNADEQVSFNENTDMLMRSHDDDNQMSTPLQIITLIKKQSIDNRKINLSSFKKTLEQNQQKQLINNSLNSQNLDTLVQSKNDLLSEKSQNQMLFKLNSFKSMNNILSAYEALNETDPQNHFQDESFLIGLTKKYKKYFSKGGQFENLIDFGNPHQIARAAQIQKSYRKKSWTLAQGIQGDENDLQDIKKKIKQNNEQKQRQQEKQRKKQKEKDENKQNKEKQQKIMDINNQIERNIRSNQEIQMQNKIIEQKVNNK